MEKKNNDEFNNGIINKEKETKQGQKRRETWHPPKALLPKIRKINNYN